MPSSRTTVAGPGRAGRRVAASSGSATITSISRPGRLERQLARPAVVADTGELGRRVEHEIGELLVDRPPGERPAGCGDDVVGYGVGLAQGAPEQFVQGVVGEIGWVTIGR